MIDSVFRLNIPKVRCQEIGTNPENVHSKSGEAGQLLSLALENGFQNPFVSIGGPLLVGYDVKKGTNSIPH